jgi:excisionase family DNA binding protein
MSAYAPSLPETTSPIGTSCGDTLTRDEVMTAREVADLLRMPVSTVYELARRGELPARRLGRTWRFLRPRLEAMFAS